MISLTPGQEKDEDEKTEPSVPEAAGGGQVQPSTRATWGKPKAMSAGESAFTTATGAQPTAQPKAPTIKGSGYTNIQKILSASGAEGAPSRLAQAVTGGTKATTQQAQQALAGAKQTFGGEIGKAETDIGGRSERASALIAKASRGESLTPQEMQEWQSIRSGSYGGPTEFGMTDEQRRKGAQVSALSKMAGDVAGRSAILQKYVGSPQYSLGQQAMDALLLGKGGSAGIRSALREGSRVEQDAARAQKAAEEQIKAMRIAAGARGEESKVALGKAEEDFMSDLAQQEKLKEQDLIEKYGKILSTVAPSVVDQLLTGTLPPGYKPRPGLNQPSDTISLADLEALGLTKTDIASISSLVDPRSYMTKLKDLESTLGGISASAYATPEDKAAAAALGEMAGVENLGLTFGERDEPLVDFDLEAYNKAVSDKVTEVRSVVEQSIPSIKTTLPREEGEQYSKVGPVDVDFNSLISNSIGKSYNEIKRDIESSNVLNPTGLNYVVNINGRDYHPDEAPAILAKMIYDLTSDPNVQAVYGSGSYRKDFTFV